LKVLFVCPFVPWPLEDGGKIRTYQLIRAASSQVEIHLRMIREPSSGTEAVAALEPWCASVRLCERTRPGRVQRWRLPKLERWFHSHPLLETVQADLDGGGFRLVHLDELLLARIVPPERALPVVQHHHKLDTVLYRALPEGQGLRQRFDLWKLHRLEAESARRYRHHLLCSQDDASTLRERYGALDCAVVPSGFDPQAFQPSPEPPPRASDRLLFLGSMNYGPNIEAVRRFVREVLPQVLAERPQAHLEIVGGNPHPDVLALAGPSVTVTGRVERVQPYLERASALVVPLAIGGGTRLKIVEALALATPVVSSSIGAQGLGLADGRELLLADTPADFTAAVLRVLREPGQARHMGEAGRRAVHEHFRWEALGKELVDYWERVAFSGALTPSR
jgi:glycosyltransferase involved in cell wall biosynthesis